MSILQSQIIGLVVIGQTHVLLIALFHEKEAFIGHLKALHLDLGLGQSH